MKKCKRLAAAAVILAMVFALSACGKSNSIVGKWEATEDGITAAYEFKSDGSGSLSVSGVSVDITWKTEGDQLTVSMELLGSEDSQAYTYSLKGNELTLSADGESLTLKRK